MLLAFYDTKLFSTVMFVHCSCWVTFSAVVCCLPFTCKHCAELCKNLKQLQSKNLYPGFQTHSVSSWSVFLLWKVFVYYKIELDVSVLNCSSLRLYKEIEDDFLYNWGEFPGLVVWSTFCVVPAFLGVCLLFCFAANVTVKLWCDLANVEMKQELKWTWN